MLTCPMCKKNLRGLEKECGNCRTDVSLIVDYIVNLDDGLKRAEMLTRSGELGEAVWSYLEVLEVDPDNATARRQVGRVARAVREFDRHSDGRQWLQSLQRRNRFQRWLGNWSEEGDLGGCLTSIFWIMLVLCAFLIGYMMGQQRVPETPPDEKPKTEQKSKSKLGNDKDPKMPKTKE